MPEDERTDRPREERDGERDEREQQRDGRVRGVGEEHVREIVRRGGAVRVEIVELNRRAHHGCGDDRAHRRACCARRRPGECGCGGFRLCFDCGHENLLVVCLRSWIGAQTQKPRTHGGVRGSSRSVPATIGGAVFGYTNQLADGEIIIRTICSRASPAMTSLLSCILRGHHVGTEPTPSHPASPSFIHIVRQLHLRYG